jgi:hypothetical protein
MCITMETNVASSFVVLWTGDRLKSATTSGWVGRSIPFAFGGPHSSHPRPSRYGVKAGDAIYPVAVSSGYLLVVCRFTVDTVVPLDAFLDDHAVADLRALLRPRGLAWLAPTCTDEAVTLRDATPVRLDCAVPAHQLTDIRFVNARGERPLNQIRNGRVTSSIGVSGHYLRLSADTASLFDEVVKGTGTAPAKTTKGPAHVAPGPTLFDSADSIDQ